MNKLTPAEKAKEYRMKNPDKVKAYAKKRYIENKEEINKYTKEYNENIRFGGKKQEALERDNWECQECGMSQEQAIVLFNRKLVIHHLDEKGSGVLPKERNHEINNLITLCSRCHGRIHRDLHLIEKWGELLEQDRSEWRFPKIRKLVQEKAKKNKITLQNAEKVIGKEFGVSKWTIDGMYYDRNKKLTKLRPKTNG